MALFEAERHEALTATPWSEAAARGALEAIVSDVHAAYRGIDGLWPLHPIDVSPERPTTLKPIYNGAAGLVWTLRWLDAAGFPAVGRDYLPMIATLAERDRADSMALLGRHTLSGVTGATGIMMLHWDMAPSAVLADGIADAIERNFRNPAIGFAWGAAGSLLAALAMLERTGGERWAQLFRVGAGELWQNWAYDEALGCHMWTQTLYGATDRFLGALHGADGVGHALLAGRDLLPDDRARALPGRLAEMAAATALREGAHANWRLCAKGSTHAGQPALRVQHCTGAPGVVNTLSALPRGDEIDALLLAAGQLTWDAGPVAKLPSLCHGVPGSGYAFLKLHARTGDGIWLERARRFAMHGIEQAERGKALHGQRKFSLWTGDLGLACFLWDCIRVSDRMPTLDFF
jgi:hypothetical protein